MSDLSFAQDLVGLASRQRAIPGSRYHVRHRSQRQYSSCNTIDATLLIDNVQTWLTCSVAVDLLITVTLVYSVRTLGTALRG